MNRFHYAFSRAVHEYDRPPDGELSLFLAAANQVRLGGGNDEAFYHILALDARRKIYSLPFLRRDTEGYIFNERSASLGETALEQICLALARERKQIDARSMPFRKKFAADELLEEIIAHKGDVGAPALPGISAPFALALQLDRYALAAPRVANHDVLDLRAGSGFGLWQVSRLARSVQSVHGTPQLEVLASRLGWSRVSQSIDFDAVLAFGLDAGELSDTLERARRVRRSGGKIILSVTGPQGRAALEDAGLVAEPLPAPAKLGVYDEWFAIDEPARGRPKTDSPATTQEGCSGRPLSIAFLLRPSAQQMFGGDVVQVSKTAESLRARGHRVDIKIDREPDVTGYDIVHATGITGVAETLGQLASVAAFPGPIVLMPIFSDHSDEAVWGMRVASIPFVFEKTSESLANQLSLLAQRAITAKNIAAPPARCDMHPQYTAAQMKILELTDHVIANAFSEIFRMKKYLLPDVPFSIAPSCVDSSIYGLEQAAGFIEKYRMRDFVLMPGRFEPRKNQIMFFQAVRRMEVQCLCIGGNYEGAWDEVPRAFWPDNVAILPEMPERDFAGAVAAARVVVLPSWNEVVSLTSLNAAISETPMVLSRNSYEHEYFGDDAEYCDPADAGSIRAAIERALEGYESRRDRRAQLALRVRAEYNWEAAAAATEAAYYRLLMHNPRGAARLARISQEVWTA